MMADNNGADLNLLKFHIKEEQNAEISEPLANETQNLENSGEQLLNENSALDALIKTVSTCRSSIRANNNGTGLNLLKFPIKEESSPTNIKIEEADGEIIIAEIEVTGGSWVCQDVDITEILTNETQNLENSDEQLLNEKSGTEKETVEGDSNIRNTTNNFRNTRLRHISMNTKRKGNHDEGTEDDEGDFEASDSDEYIPSEDESSNSDFLESSESENENEVIDELETSDIHDASSTTWTAVTGLSLKTFNFTVADSHDLPEESTMRPIDVFYHMVTDDIFQLIVTETNANANKFLRNNTIITRNSYIKRWVDTTIPEIKRFLGLVMYMGIVKYPSICYYWSTNKFYKNEFVPQVMSRNRFQLILKFIHFSDNSAVIHNRLGKITGLLDLLETNFVKLKRPDEVLAVDESMIPWRERLHFRQYNPGKAHKYGVKLYKLCDPSGYTYTSSLYAGKHYSHKPKGRPTPQASHSTQIVLDLAEKYLDEGRTIVTDNFHTSVSLAQMLLARQTHLIGTLRKNSSGIPKDVIMAELKQSEVIGRENSSVVVAKWKDKHDVIMLSTKHLLQEIPARKRPGRATEVKKPQMVADYNYAKHGIDISNQMTCYFTPLQKSIRWYHKIAFQLLLSTSVVNAFLIYKRKQNASILQFRQSICENLCLQNIEERPSSTKHRHELKEFETRDHTNRKTRKRCLSCYNNLARDEGRNAAAKKAKRVSTFCSGCERNPAICLECFRKHR